MTGDKKPAAKKPTGEHKTTKRRPNAHTKRLVQVGRIAYIAFGKDTGKLVCIVDIVDHNRALVDSPHILRQQIPYRALHLTKFVVRVPRGASTRCLRKLWAKAKMDEKWKATSWAKRIESKKRRASLNDFERFKLLKLKIIRNRLVRVEVNKLRKVAKKDEASKKKTGAPAKGKGKEVSKAPASKAAAPAPVKAAAPKKK